MDTLLNSFGSIIAVESVPLNLALANFCRCHAVKVAIGKKIMFSWKAIQENRLQKILFSLFFLLTILLNGYVGLSLKIGCSLTFVEFVRFSSIIIWNSALHAEDNGGSKSFQISKEVALNSISSEAVEVKGKKYSYPLPKFSISQKDGFYLTFASDAELQNYFYKELQTAGWKHVDQMGAGHFFEGHGAKMIMTSHFYL